MNLLLYVNDKIPFATIKFKQHFRRNKLNTGKKLLKAHKSQIQAYSKRLIVQ